MSKEKLEATWEKEEETTDEETTEDTTDETTEEDSELKELIGMYVKEAVGDEKKQLEEKAQNHARAAREAGIIGSDGKQGLSQLEKNKQVADFMKAVRDNDKAVLKDYQATDTDADGGFLVPEILTEEIARIPEDFYGVAERTFRNWTFSGAGNQREIPVLDQNVSASWTGEGSKKAGTKFTLTRPTLSMKKLAAIVPMTEEVVEDSAVNLQSFVAELIVEQFSKKEDEEFFATGDGEFTGILDDTNINVHGTQVDPADLTADHLADLQLEVNSNVRKNGVFYMSPSIFNIVRQLQDTNGQYIVQSPTADRPGRIWDRPYVLVDAMPDSSSVGNDDNYVLFADLRRAASYGRKQGIRSRLLDQATIEDESENQIHLAMQDMFALRFMKRVGYVLHQPNAVAAIQSTSA